MPMPEAAVTPGIVTDSRDPNAIVTLRSAHGRRCAKHFVKNADGTIAVVPYDNENRWFVEVLPCPDLATFTAGLEILTRCRDRIVVRGALRDDIAEQPLLRRVVGAGAAFQAQARSWVALDVDGFTLAEAASDVPPAERVAHVIARLPDRFRGAACFYQYTSSYGISANLNVMRLRLWFRLSHPMTDAAWKRELRVEAPTLSLDLSLYNPVQPHYTAAPTFQDMEDPVQHNRCGVHDPVGASPFVNVENIVFRNEMDLGTILVSAITRTGIQAHPDQIANILQRFASRARSASRHSTAVALIGELYGHGLSGEEAMRHAGAWMESNGRGAERGELERALLFVQRRAHSGELRTNDTPVSLMFESVEEAEEPPPTPEQAAENVEQNETVLAEWPTQPNAMARRAYVDLFHSEGYVRWGEIDYHWTGTYWRPMADDEELGARIQRASGMTPTACERATKALRNDHHKSHLVPPCTLIDGLPVAPRIQLLNGWLSVASLRAGEPIVLKPYTVDTFDLIPPMPVAYDAEAMCPRFNQFLDEVFAGSVESRRALIRLMGYLLFKGNEYQRIFICTGLPASGKSTWLRVMRELLGEIRSSVGDLRAFSTDFGLASCYQSQALFLPEASHGEIGIRMPGEAIDQLKRITGGDPVLIRRKYLGDVSAAVMPTPVVICNAPPVVRDEAFVRRLVTIHFPHSFLGREDPTLTTQLLREIPGILLIALDGLRQISNLRDPFPPPDAAVGHDVEPSAAREVYESIRSDSSPIAEFIRRCVVRAEGGFIPYDQLHQAYSRWCSANSYRALDMGGFGRALRFGLGLPRGRRRLEQSVRHYGLDHHAWTEDGRRFCEASSVF